MSLADIYRNDVMQSETNERELRNQLNEAKTQLREGKLSRQAYREAVAAIEEAIRDNRLARVKAYERLASSLGESYSASAERAKQWREQQQEHAREIMHDANSDLNYVEVDTQRKESTIDRIMNSSVVRFFMAPFSTFNYMLRFFGRYDADGRGYLWERFMNDGTKASEREWKKTYAARKELDAKANEFFEQHLGKGGGTWSKLHAWLRDQAKIKVDYLDGDEVKTHELTQGNVMYMYMVNKMKDGKMKLRKMNITEEDVARYADQLAPGVKELADWIQNELLTRKRGEYNEVYERMFGVTMDNIENYFPLRINQRERRQNIDVGSPTYAQERMSELTGSVRKRVVNSVPLDLANADALAVTLDHITEMEHWAAYAEMTRDLNTLLSYKRFRNRVMNMRSFRYGAGNTMWKNFVDTCAIVVGAYQPPPRPPRPGCH